MIDDFADSPEFSRNSKLLHGLYTRGRHSQISTVVATQKFNALHPYPSQCLRVICIPITQ